MKKKTFYSTVIDREFLLLIVLSVIFYGAQVGCLVFVVYKIYNAVVAS